MSPVSILSIPFDANSSYLRGPAEGPLKIVEAFHCDSANLCTQDGTDLSNLSEFWKIEPSLSFNSDDSPEAFEKIHDYVSEYVNAGKKVLSLGGDHSITFPIIKAHAQRYPNLHILQIDAHGDLYDNFQENYFSHASPFARIMENGLASSLTQIGNRTLNPHQREQAERFQVTILEMKDFDLANLPQIEGPLYISFDLDVLDPAFAPGVSHHEPGGLTTREALKIFETLKVPIVGADIVELNPQRDVQGMTAMLAGKLMKELLALMI